MKNNELQLTNYHCKYIAYDLTRKSVNGQDRLSMALFNAAVDLNPHQIEAALFSLQSPLSMGSLSIGRGSWWREKPLDRINLRTTWIDRRDQESCS